ncbi:MAG: PAS domain S-box protein [Deltaproteobacteria bacterium]|nr:PAS domain S-box protein [Deltaproteobacteria bacterium]MBI3389092.1 PAS domain S-box protein [Deltaproteobacteria bacterium]
MEPVYDSSLEAHLRRIEGYMRGCHLLTYPREHSALRDELANFIRTACPTVLDTWVELIGTAFNIPEWEWPGIHEGMSDALGRWIAHIVNPADIDTYVYLRSHARRGFISQFSASRFLSGQMKLRHMLADRLREQYADQPEKLDALSALLQQEFQERLLHITDFFVEGREEELREQEASYRNRIDNSPAVMFKLDYDIGTVLDANIVAEKLMGYRRDEMAGMRLWDLLPPTERPRAQRLLEETKVRGHSEREDLHLQTRRGEIVPVFFNAGLIEYGHQRYFQIICVDISDRKRLESQLIQSEKMAAIGQLAAGIAHEIRNPLGIILNALYDLSELVDRSNPEIQEDLQIAKDEMGRVQEIINNLLEFSRESRAELEPVDINDLLRKTLQLIHKSLQNADVRVTTDLGLSAPCLANQNALRQIFLNLITNAVQAMPHGGELRLRTASLPNGRVQIEFSDSGVGIPEDSLKDIFNPFFTTKAPGQGTGLGLSVVHSVVQRYQGEITVRSKPNEGSTFIIELPCQCGTESQAIDAHLHAAAPAASPVH